MEPGTISTEFNTETISDELDRLEIPAGTIGLITSDQAMALLRGLDHVYARIQALAPESPTRRRVEVQFDGLVSRLRREAARFLRDLGGAGALQQAREQIKPPQDHTWWYLDQYVAAKRRASLRRSLIILGSLAVLLVVLALLYQRFLAPSPQESARYGALQMAQDSMMNGDLTRAAQQVDQGLQAAPNDPELLVMKGVIQEQQGQANQAQQTYAAAQKGLPRKEDFYIARGQAYGMANQPEKALADAQAVLKLNPQSPQAYLLAGQADETLSKFEDALTAYDKAFEAANATNQPALAAIARTRTAMLMQTMNMPRGTSSETQTPTAKP